MGNILSNLILGGHMPGPPPSRKDALLGHRSKAELAGETVDKVKVKGKVERPEPSDQWGDLAKLLWEAGLSAAQSKYYEATDYAYLWFLCDSAQEMVDSEGRTGRSAMKIQSITQMMRDLLFTEAERRRAQIEIDRELGDKQLEAEADDYINNIFA